MGEHKKQDQHEPWAVIKKGETTMKYILTYWNYRKQDFATIELDGEIERDNVLSWLKRDGWKNIHGVWHSPKENALN